MANRSLKGYQHKDGEGLVPGRNSLFSQTYLPLVSERGLRVLGHNHMPIFDDETPTPIIEEIDVRRVIQPINAQTAIYWFHTYRSTTCENSIWSGRWESNPRL
jgi:hypothetical protein